MKTVYLQSDAVLVICSFDSTVSVSLIEVAQHLYECHLTKRYLVLLKVTEVYCLNYMMKIFQKEEDLIFFLPRFSPCLNMQILFQVK